MSSNTNHGFNVRGLTSELFPPKNGVYITLIERVRENVVDKNIKLPENGRSKSNTWDSISMACSLFAVSFLYKRNKVMHQYIKVLSVCTPKGHHVYLPRRIKIGKANEAVR